MKKSYLAFFTVLCMLIGIVSNAQALTKEEIIQGAEKHYTNAIDRLYTEQNYSKIVEEGQKLIQKGDNISKLFGYIFLVEGYMQLGEKEKAFNALTELSKIDTENYIIPFLSLNVYLEFGEQEKGLNLCLNAVKRYPEQERIKSEMKCRNTVADFNEVSASKIWNAFNENEIAAEDQYKNKLIAVEGKVSKIATSITGEPEVTMNVDQYGMQTVTFAFPKDARAEIAKLKKGKKMKIAGRCRGFIMGLTVHFTDCWLPE